MRSRNVGCVHFSSIDNARETRRIRFSGKPRIDETPLITKGILELLRPAHARHLSTT